MKNLRLTSHSRPETGPRMPASRGREKIPERWAWHYRTLMHLRQRALQAHDEHASQANLPPDTESNDPADAAQEQSIRDLLWTELGAENDRLLEIDSALARIREGTYGICETTGRSIGLARLRAVPWTRYCRTAAEARENRPPRKIS